MVKLLDVYNAIDNFAPYDAQFSYDNSGIKVGDKDLPVTGIMVTLDTTMSVIMEAKERGCNVIVEHHPSIWKPLYDIDTFLPLNECLVTAIKLDIAIISAHTNIDVAENGLGDYVAKLMGLHCV
ncbi:MAG TPA: Nif3-like dinuclear metal center hexameric protein, partial [Clostridia bacterium]|nr:Nif3-like dinuclear metal center hexameric protein [Clostridia bacterium]